MFRRQGGLRPMSRAAIGTALAIVTTAGLALPAAADEDDTSAAPINVQAISYNGRVRLYWDQPTAPVPADHWMVYRSTTPTPVGQPDSDARFLYETGGRRAGDTLPDDSSYYYSICVVPQRPVADWFCSAPVAPTILERKPAQPDTPVGLWHTEALGAITLRWQKPENDDASLAGYVVYRWDSDSAVRGKDTATRLNSTPQDGLEFTDRTVSGGKDYSYAVAAVSKDGVESELVDFERAGA
ncbi:fibronectin type III domain-containing protein [Streptomyces sp. AV19]|uniref:fibronectin type III domain-containing protein n=1 Tax=Streptomyces sp. AV19 TaxID=2793068 RepID=UPI0018FEF0F3|nr:fibronectin type III domain-containing protein [Streptomyces sp. AV19]MBH1935125.1 fibronectin type III domain-containing protein [Streptomyces sp. AV19]MDG4531058.1 fibronectin type III domain-containing protein [Streptomyces sp. AV19]